MAAGESPEPRPPRPRPGHPSPSRDARDAAAGGLGHSSSSSSVLIFTACAHRPASHWRLLRLEGFRVRAVSRNGLSPPRGQQSAPALGWAGEGLQRRRSSHEAPDPARPPLAVGLRLLQGRRLPPEPAAFACRPRQVIQAPGWLKAAEGLPTLCPSAKRQVKGPQDPAQWVALPSAWSQASEWGSEPSEHRAARQAEGSGPLRKEGVRDFFPPDDKSR